MRPLVTCLKDKLAKVYLNFKKIEEKVYILEEICDNANEAVSLPKNMVLNRNNYKFVDRRVTGINLSKAVKQYWQRSLQLLFLEVAFADIKTYFS